MIGYPNEKTIFSQIYRDMKTKGVITCPRGQKILELQDYMFVLGPYERFTSFKARKMNMNYIKAELLWYLKGDPYDDMIIDHSQVWVDIRQPDGKFLSNYGQYIFGDQNGYRFVIDELIIDKDSRRAVIPFLNRDHMFHENKDVVCTYSMSFRIRNNMLHMSINMRSNDAIWGMTNDIACFSIIHEIVYTGLKDYIPGIILGPYCHKVDSLHVYERHFKMLDQLVKDGEQGYEKIVIPKITDYVEVGYLFEHILYKTPIRRNYPFTDWLLS